MGDLKAIVERLRGLDLELGRELEMALESVHLDVLGDWFERQIARWDFEMREYGPTPAPLADFLADALTARFDVREGAGLDSTESRVQP